MADLAPSYPASDITPSGGTGGSSRSSSSGGVNLRKLWSSRSGRLVLAGVAAAAMIVYTLVRRDESAEAAVEETPAATGMPGAGIDDPFAGMGSNAIAQPIPSNGFQFGGGYTSTGGDMSDVEITDPVPPPPTKVVIEVVNSPSVTSPGAPPASVAPSPVVDTGGVSGNGAGSPGGGPSPGPTTPTQPAAKKPQGYYRARDGGAVTYVNAAGVGDQSKKFTAVQIAGVNTVEGRVKKSRKMEEFVLDGIWHQMETSLAFHPRGA